MTRCGIGPKVFTIAVLYGIPGSCFPSDNRGTGRMPVNRVLAGSRKQEAGSMTDRSNKEMKRRSVLKSLIWRVIGIVWTWVGAYLILLFIPPSRRSAALVATIIVVYHHSTRMIMYYFYERIWASISWGTREPPRPISWKEQVLWTMGTLVTLAVVFFLIVYVTPKLRKMHKTCNKPLPLLVV